MSQLLFHIRLDIIYTISSSCPVCWRYWSWMTHIWCILITTWGLMLCNMNLFVFIFMNMLDHRRCSCFRESLFEISNPKLHNHVSTTWHSTDSGSPRTDTSSKPRSQGSYLASQENMVLLVWGTEQRWVAHFPLRNTPRLAARIYHRGLCVQQ